MKHLQRLERLINWAFGLSVLAIAVVFFGLGICQPATATVISASAVMKAGQETRPPPGAPDQEWEDWNTRQKPVREVVHYVAGRTVQTTTLFVGLPIAVLLIAVCILLSRLRTRLLRGE